MPFLETGFSPHRDAIHPEQSPTSPVPQPYVVRIAREQQVGCIWRYRCRCWYPANNAPSSERLPLLRRGVFSVFGNQILWQPNQRIKNLRRISRTFAQYDLITTPEDFHLLYFETKFLRQPNGLAIPRFKNTRVR